MVPPRVPSSLAFGVRPSPLAAMATLSAASARVTRCARVASRVGVGRVLAAAGAIPSVRAPLGRRGARDVEDAIYRVMSKNQRLA